MFHGFYNLTSGMLYQNRKLNVIANNLANAGTAGFKTDRIVSTTFKEAMLYRNGNVNKQNPSEVGSVSMIRAARNTVTSHTQGGLTETGNHLDFALSKPGFYILADSQGNQVYSRSGAFQIDQDKELSLPAVGKVLGTDKRPIRMTTDHIRVDDSGNIYAEPEGAGSEPVLLGTIGVVDFTDYKGLIKGNNGTFMSGEAPVQVDGGIKWKHLEQSNMNPVTDMTAMMSSQRASQSAAQVLKMYDQLMSKIVSDIGRV